MSGTLDEERAKQHAEHYAEADRLVRLMVDGDRQIREWKYIPPSSDDWADWQGMTRWCAVERLYAWEIKTYVALADGKGPFYCPGHGEQRPGEGWRARSCRDCAWQDHILDDALKLARELGRPGARRGAA